MNGKHPRWSDIQELRDAGRSSRLNSATSGGLSTSGDPKSQYADLVKLSAGECQAIHELFNLYGDDRGKIFLWYVLQASYSL